MTFLVFLTGFVCGVLAVVCAYAAERRAAEDAAVCRRVGAAVRREQNAAMRRKRRTMGEWRVG